MIEEIAEGQIAPRHGAQRDGLRRVRRSRRHRRAAARQRDEHRRGVKPSEFVKVGDVVDVKIIKFDRETGKLSLSLKQTMADPWVGAEDKYAVGTQITGRVSKVENFGAFIEVEEGRRRAAAGQRDELAADQASQRHREGRRHAAAGRAHPSIPLQQEDELQPQAGRPRSVEDGERAIRDRHGRERAP